MAEKACHVLASTTQVGLIQALERIGDMSNVKNLWASRFLASALVFGGAGGIMVSAMMAFQFSHQSWTYIFTTMTVAMLYVLTIVIGVALWKNSKYGRTLAAVLFASQVPVILLPNLSYEWFTGMAIKYIGGHGKYEWSAALGASDNFQLQSGITEAAYGINVFAAVASTYLLLVRSNNSFKPKPLRGSA